MNHTASMCHCAPRKSPLIVRRNNKIHLFSKKMAKLVTFYETASLTNDNNTYVNV